MNKEQRAEEFLKELELLCIKHKIQISMSFSVSSYADIEIWDKYRDEPYIYSGSTVENYLKELK